MRDEQSAVGTASTGVLRPNVFVPRGLCKTPSEHDQQSASSQVGDLVADLVSEFCISLLVSRMSCCLPVKAGQWHHDLRRWRRENVAMKG